MLAELIKGIIISSLPAGEAGLPTPSPISQLMSIAPLAPSAPSKPACPVGKSPPTGETFGTLIFSIFFFTRKILLSGIYRHFAVAANVGVEEPTTLRHVPGW